MCVVCVIDLFDRKEKLFLNDPVNRMNWDPKKHWRAPEIERDYKTKKKFFCVSNYNKTPIVVTKFDHALSFRFQISLWVFWFHLAHISDAPQRQQELEKNFLSSRVLSFFRFHLANSVQNLGTLLRRAFLFAVCVFCFVFFWLAFQIIPHKLLSSKWKYRNSIYPCFKYHRFWLGSREC